MLRTLREFFFRPAQSLPEKCFISHSYADAPYVEQLKTLLPKAVEPFVFPPITVSPEQRVSDDLVKAILGCPGLIHIDSKKSAASVWVNFERDFALRSRKRVFKFRPAQSSILLDDARPLDLNTFPTYARRDHHLVEQILDFMNARHFSLFQQRDLMSAERLQETITSSISHALSAGGYTVAFISGASTESQWVLSELELSERLNPGRILPALLEPTGLPPALQSLVPATLFQDGVSPRRIDWNRVDDLIVRIYAMIYKNQRGGLQAL